jgi:hypothetical protein
MAENEKQAKDVKSTIEEKSAEVIKVAKKFQILTLLGLGLGILFIIFLFFIDLYVRWWLMLPLGAVSIYLLYRQQQKTTGLEKKLCVYGFWVMIALVLLRDLLISSKMSDIVDLPRDFRMR